MLTEIFYVDEVARVLAEIGSILTLKWQRKHFKVTLNEKDIFASFLTSFDSKKLGS